MSTLIEQEEKLDDENAFRILNNQNISNSKKTIIKAKKTIKKKKHAANIEVVRLESLSKLSSYRKDPTNFLNSHFYGSRLHRVQHSPRRNVPFLRR